jgi:threonine aldolase
MHDAEVGDDGRTGADGKGEDPTVTRLESLAAEATGKEDALFVSSGTLGNLVALLTNCKRGDTVGVEKDLHIVRSEKAAFSDRIGGLLPAFFEADSAGKPIQETVIRMLREQHPRLLCLENTHNFAGGTYLDTQQLEALAKEAKQQGVIVHLDGARIFNAAVALDVPVYKLTQPVASVMFCLSKGLGAPAGSVLCADRAFIREARETRKLLGGAMRQVGVIAAAGIVALKSGAGRLEEDHRNARFLAERIAGARNISLNLDTVKTNIVMVDVAASGRTASQYERDLEARGLKVLRMCQTRIRMVTYRGITRADTIAASDMFSHYCDSL